MKKILMLALVCVLSLSCLYGCKRNAKETKKETEQNEELDFVKPKEYDTVLTVTINPIFRLYLNSENEVIAIEPVNKDAKGIVNDIEQETKKLDEVINNIVKCADENNFLKKDATVDVKIVETTSAQDKQTEILVIVKDTVKDNFEGINVNTSVDIEDSKKDNSGKKDKEQNSDDKDKKKEDNKKADKEQTVNDKNSTADKKQDNTTQNTTQSHKHQYTNATCTQPKTCSCGASEGKSLAHSWKDATCKAPKTCSECKTTQGNTVEHSFDSSGKCKWCKQVLPVYPSQLKNGAYQLIRSVPLLIAGKDAPGIFVVQVDFAKKQYLFAELIEGDYARQQLGRPAEADWSYNGKDYYDFEGGVESFDSKISNNHIMIEIEYFGCLEVELRSNDTLKVISVLDGEGGVSKDVLVGDIFVYSQTPYYPSHMR